MWDMTVSVPDHCLSFYFALSLNQTSSKHALRHLLQKRKTVRIIQGIVALYLIIVF